MATEHADDGFVRQMNEEASFLDDDDDVLEQDPEPEAKAEEPEEPEEPEAEAEDEEPEAEDDDEEAEDDEAEDDDEEAEDDDEEDEEKPAAKAEAKPDDKPYMIPKSRYDSVKARLDKALDELNSMKKTGADAGLPDAGKLSDDLEDISKQLNEALSTGDVDKANELRRQERELTSQVFEHKAQQVAQAQIEQLRYQDFVADVEELYPELNPDGDTFDRDVSREVVDLVEAFEARGYRPTEALKRAVGYVFPQGPTAEQVKEESKAKTVDDVALRRKAQALKRNAKASKGQPPSTKNKGVDSDKAGPKGPLNLAELSEEEFDALDLDSEEMRKARGDFNVKG